MGGKRFINATECAFLFFYAMAQLSKMNLSQCLFNYSTILTIPFWLPKMWVIELKYSQLQSMLYFLHCQNYLQLFTMQETVI